MVSDQFVIPINFETPSMAVHDFIVSQSNQEAHLWVMSPEKWPANLLLIYGETGSGKSHLAHIWAQQNQAQNLNFETLSSPDFIPQMQAQNYVLDGIDLMLVGGGSVYQKNVFHVLNAVREHGGRILMTARKSQNEWHIQLPDLRSRLMAIPALEILPPDDVLLEMLLYKLFSDRQIKIDSDVISYIVPRIERSAAHIVRLVELIDHESLKHKKTITVPMARGILKNFDGAAQSNLPL